MTDACNTTHYTDRPMAPAKLMNCQECPFRKENQNREHPNGTQYTAEEFTTIWRAVSQDGAQFACHMWDADLHPFNEAAKVAGYHKPVDVGSRIECAGMVAMVERELDIADASPTYTEYNLQRPVGLSKKSVLAYSSRRSGKSGPELRFSEHINKGDILDPHDVINPESLKWRFAEPQADALLRTVEALMPSLRECNCKVCQHHTEVHDARELTTAENLTVQVDADLHPLLSVLASTGIRTTDSCINLYEPIMALSPDRYGPITNGYVPGTMNYGSTLRRRAAFIRLHHGSAAEQSFIAGAERIPGVEVTSSGALTQIVFPKNSIPALMNAAQV